MRVIGISGGFGHNAAAALVVDGLPVFAIEEERLSRVKEAPWAVPVGAIAAALEAGGCSIGEIDALAVSWDPALMVDERRPAIFFDDVVNTLHMIFGTCPPVAKVAHHLAHAAAGFYTSGFEDAAVVVLDDRGEDRSGSVFRGHGGCLDEVLTIPIRASLGAMFTSATMHLGFEVHQAGKTMGLAAHGTVTHELPWLRPTEDGYQLASDFVSGFGPDGEFPDWPSMFEHAFGPAAGVDGHRRRRNGVEDFSPAQLNAAASAQAALERTVLHLGSVACRLAASTNLVLSGGVALNCTVNGKLRLADEGRGLHVFGAAGDAGGALGAALWVALGSGDPRPPRLDSLALGREHGSADLIQWARNLGLEPRVGPIEELATVVAQGLAGGRIGGWFQGADEFGPRALGNRSIISTVDDVTVAARVNQIKGREGWRPLAPALDREAALAAGVAPLGPGLDAMIEARWPCRPSPLTGAVHVDGSTRPLVVSEADHALAPLLAAVGEVSGTAAVVNTSFNVGGEPLVHTPGDALRTFCTSDLDFLCVGGVLLAKPASGVTG